MIERPIIIKAIVERPVLIRPIIEKAIIEQPVFVRPARERPMIEKTVIMKPLFDWCGDLVVPLDPEATAPRVGRSLKDMFETGRYTPSSGLKRSYLAAVRAKPEDNPQTASGAVAVGSCCGDTPSGVTLPPVKSVATPKLARYCDQPPPRFPLTRPAEAKRAVAAARTAPAAALGAIAATTTTMVVPRGSR